nr:HAD-IB family phosphatase [Thiocapsa imhoffii]
MLDFDGTITRRDTTRDLLKALLGQRPWLVFRILPLVLAIVVSREGERIQQAKNTCVGLLLKGLNEKRLDLALTDYARLVQPLLRPELIQRIEDKVNQRCLVLVVTASFDGAVRVALRDAPVTVIGTRYVQKAGCFTGAVDGPGCYGHHKPQRIRQATIDLGNDLRFAEAWSDAVSDLPMMKMAERRVWVYRDQQPAAFRQADPDGEYLKLA